MSARTAVNAAGEKLRTAPVSFASRQSPDEARSYCANRKAPSAEDDTSLGAVWEIMHRASELSPDGYDKRCADAFGSGFAMHAGVLERLGSDEMIADELVDWAMAMAAGAGERTYFPRTYVRAFKPKATGCLVNRCGHLKKLCAIVNTGSGRHWIAAIWDRQEATVQVYDSMGSNSDTLHDVQVYLDEVRRLIAPGEKVPRAAAAEQIRQGLSSNDCGLFALYCAARSLAGLPVFDGGLSPALTVAQAEALGTLWRRELAGVVRDAFVHFVKPKPMTLLDRLDAALREIAGTGGGRLPASPRGSEQGTGNVVPTALPQAPRRSGAHPSAGSSLRRSARSSPRLFTALNTPEGLRLDSKNTLFREPESAQPVTPQTGRLSSAKHTPVRSGTSTIIHRSGRKNDLFSISPDEEMEPVPVTPTPKARGARTSGSQGVRRGRKV